MNKVMTLEMKKELLEEHKMLLTRFYEYTRGGSSWQFITDAEYIVSLIERDLNEQS